MFKNHVRPAGALTAAAVAVGLLIAGCGGSSGSDSATTGEASTGSESSSTSTGGGAVSGTVHMLGLSPQEPAMSALIEEFEEANPEVEIAAQYGSPESYYQVLTTQIQGGNAPDVFYTNGGTGQTTAIVPLAEAGKVADLSGSPWVSEIPKAADDLYLVDGKAYGLPLWEKPLGVIYNVAEFQKLGVALPKTWQQFLQTCGQIKAAGKIPIAGIGTNYMNAIIPAASTVYAEDPEWNAERTAEKVTFAGTQGWTEALEMVTEMKEAECFQPGVEGAQVAQALQLIGSGEALMYLGPSDSIGAIAASGTVKQLGSYPLPGKSEATTRAVNAYSDALAVSSSSSNLSAAKAFLDFLAEPAHAKRLAELAGTISIQQAAEGQLPKELAAYAPFYKQGKTVAYPPDSWPGSGSLEAFTTGVQELLTGQNDPAGVLEAADEGWGK